jgi:hypothetical protein
VKLRSLLLIPLALLAMPVAAELPVSPLGDIYETFNDCLAVADKTGISKDKLTSLGWARAAMTSSDGKPMAGGPIIYGNAKRKPIIVLSAESGEGMCMVMSRIESDATFPEFLKAWGPELPPPAKDGSIGFYDGGHPVLIRLTGTKEKPALTMSVMTPSEKK